MRTWLQAHNLTWMTPARLRAATIVLFVAAFGVSSVGLSGSTSPSPRVAQHAGAASAR